MKWENDTYLKHFLASKAAEVAIQQAAQPGRASSFRSENMFSRQSCRNNRFCGFLNKI
jgi:hypothetical protein